MLSTELEQSRISKKKGNAEKGLEEGKYHKNVKDAM